jgi:hypothetical protein
MTRIAAPRLKQLCAACLAALASHAAWSASGEFTFVTGEVTLTKANGQRSTPARGTAVDPGDRIATGANGMAQLNMVDQARLSLRPQTQFVIEAYPDKRDSDTGSVLNLIRGTLRTFTGLISAGNREKFVMKTRVATVGIRGSGNILYACDDKECDESVAGAANNPGGSLTVNHTIDGSHSVAGSTGATGAIVTGPGQTVLVAANQPPRFIPTPSFIADMATNMTGRKESAAAPATGAAAETRNYSPSDTLAVPITQQAAANVNGGNGLGFPIVDTSTNVGTDPLALRDIVMTVGSPLYGQALASDVVLDGNGLRAFRAYPTSSVVPTIVGGTLLDFGSSTVGGGSITWGRWANASIGFFGGGGATAVPGSIHWINAPSGYPAYLAEVLTGTATYTLAGGTNPTNQNNIVGTVGSAALNVNFTDRTLGFSANISMPASGGAAAGSWQMTAVNVPIALDSFYASTQDRLRITNGTGSNSSSSNDLAGSIQGSFAGTGLSAAVLGYGISDSTASDLANWQFVSGVLLFVGVRQDPTAEYREGRVSDANGSLSQFVQSFATTDRPAEVTANAQGGLTAFSAPSATLGAHATYALGSAQIVQSGLDPETGMVWGRWGGGTATVTRGTQSEQLFLNSRSLHYIFAGTQSGPVTLPLTGTGVYDVIGSTSPTDFNGHVGTLNSATLNANFSNRTADATVNIAIAGQTWNASATGMGIYRDQYFSAYTGTPIQGVPNPAPLVISCTPNCGQGASGSFDGFFTGRSGQRAGMMYNMGGNQGAIAFGRRGG